MPHIERGRRAANLSRVRRVVQRVIKKHSIKFKENEKRVDKAGVT